MSNEKMITITEGLVELKTLDARIQKEISSNVFIASHLKGKSPNGFSSVDVFNAKVKSTLQSIKDLIARRNKIKSAIVNSNAVTKVTIGSKTYTVAEAIERKQSVALEVQLLSTLMNQFNSCYSQVERSNNQAQERLDKQIETSLGKDAKSNPEDIKTISEIFWNKNDTIVADPIGIREAAETLAKEIDSFRSEVDVRLSISNSTTMIEVV